MRVAADCETKVGAKKLVGCLSVLSDCVSSCRES